MGLFSGPYGEQLKRAMDQVKYNVAVAKLDEPISDSDAVVLFAGMLVVQNVPVNTAFDLACEYSDLISSLLENGSNSREA
ncbi:MULTISPECIES: hypothetical protein [unclassified Ensifer]|uniref:hypothetical protein n=1 Tax=unclassified Ensifer TaxID=2633371 RepID=UPI0011126363|nr:MULTISPECIES: hypothetical protein [unclassified Ensifer]